MRRKGRVITGISLVELLACGFRNEWLSLRYTQLISFLGLKAEMKTFDIRHLSAFRFA
jgi:hypothetical protein